jgi:hypothetical protein
VRRFGFYLIVEASRDTWRQWANSEVNMMFACWPTVFHD